jgi:hypothetical protein
MPATCRNRLHPGEHPGAQRLDLVTLATCLHKGTLTYQMVVKPGTWEHVRLHFGGVVVFHIGSCQGK